MATPYLQLWVEEVPSTQDLARSERPSAGARRRRATIGRGRGRGGLDLRTTSPRGLTRIPPPLTTAGPSH